MAYRIQQRIGVAAPASAVWNVIGDLESWPEWNAMFPLVEGRLSVGALLNIQRVTGGVSERFEARVVDWVPAAQIIWARSIAPFASSLTYLEIDPLTERGCILAAGELFEGRLGEVIGKKTQSKLAPAFLALCEAAKARAEAAWDGVPDEPVPPPTPPPLVRPLTPKLMAFSLRGKK